MKIKINDLHIGLIGLVIVYLIFSCQPKPIDPDIYSKWTPITIKKGDHKSSPIDTKVLTGDCHLEADFKFTEGSRYFLNDIDSLDWNKLFGFKLDYNNVPNHSAMVGWRYSKWNNTWEVCPYFNNDGIVFPDTNEILTVSEKEIIKCEAILQSDKAIIKISANGQSITKTQILKKGVVYTSVGVWFGGNKTAPNDIIVWKRKK